MSTDAMDAELADVFARQLGLLTLRQARALGLTGDGVRHRIRAGAWELVSAGLYRLRGSPSSWEQTVLSRVLQAGDQATASHFTALRLWGFLGFDEHSVEVTVPIARRPRIADAVVHRSGTVQVGDRRVVAQIPVLSAPRTMFDVASRFDDRALGSIIDDGLRRRVLTLGALHVVARRLPTIAPGRSPTRMARLLADRTAGYHPGDSELETRVHAVLVECGLPPPVRQCRVIVNGRTYFIDLAYPDARVGIEVDGFQYHRERGAFDRDRKRQNDLVGAGWTILRFTSRSTDSEIVSAVRAALSGRSCGAEHPRSPIRR